MSKLRQVPIILATLLLLFVIFMSCSDNSVSSVNDDDIEAPRLSFSDTLFNFGYVPQLSRISHDFRLYSTGNDTLKILSVRPG